MDVLIIDDEKSIREATRIAIEAEGHYAEAVDGGQVALLRMKEDPFDLVILDLRLGDEDGIEVLEKIKKHRPNTVVVMFTAFATVETAVKAIQMGAFDYLEKPFTPDQLRSVLVRAEKQSKVEAKIDHLQTEVATLKQENSKNSPPLRFDTEEPAMKESLDVLFRAAPTPATILILGESGTGKSVVARAVHERSHLAEKPFVTVSCPSLSKELLESELFGHVRGAFTGAVKDKWGKVHAADGGTLFLDEIGELPPEIQPKLLRLLQEREYERVGESTTRQAKVRVVAATNRNLAQLVEEGSFREDLYYRLNVITVEMPPLRNRPADLMGFAESYAEFFAGQIGRELNGFAPDAKARLMSYPWPGNLRELRNVTERAVILCPGDGIAAKDLSGLGEAAAPGALNGESLMAGGDVTIEEIEEAHIRRVLERCGTMKEAAETLGINKATLYRKRQKLGLE
ncbi:MAG: sigma-54-dependent Fis family transcriptional regulator [Akkermansiaceae bacterium]|nr:sigma-54-dependent Fis family transcriptional regulator [Akkermansiaceae bacterium]NNM30004.1 sigma-54-dependent Fis family transcriptional regulator [Akkermansiaceae bacterium]